MKKFTLKLSSFKNIDPSHYEGIELDDAFFEPEEVFVLNGAITEEVTLSLPGDYMYNIPIYSPAKIDRTKDLAFVEVHDPKKPLPVKPVGTPLPPDPLPNEPLRIRIPRGSGRKHKKTRKAKSRKTRKTRKH